MSAEGHHDFGIIPLGGFVDLPLVGHIEVGGGQVGAEEIAGKQYLVLSQIGEHRLRPVHPGGIDELQRPVSQRDSLFVSYGLKLFLGNHEQAGEHILTLGRAEHLGLGVFLQHLGDGAGVVLLGVVGNNIVYTLDLELI
ncbi:hypothetical protein ES703_50656 [subsurface metagenome]